MFSEAQSVATPYHNVSCSPFQMAPEDLHVFFPSAFGNWSVRWVWQLRHHIPFFNQFICTCLLDGVNERYALVDRLVCCIYCRGLPLISCHASATIFERMCSHCKDLSPKWIFVDIDSHIYIYINIDTYIHIYIYIVCISSYQKPCHIKHVAFTQSDLRPKAIVFRHVICYLKPCRSGDVSFFWLCPHRISS